MPDPSDPRHHAPPKPQIKPWREIDSQPHADCRVFTVRRRVCRHPDRGAERDFFFLDSPNWVNVVALTDKREIVLIHQFRFGIADFSLEIPGGLIDDGEDPIQAGLRELTEETGFVAKKARLLGSVRPNPAILNNTCHFVLAEEAVCTEPHCWDPDEEIEVLLASPEKALAWAHSGDIDHAMVVNALFLFEPVWRAWQK